MKKKNLVTLVLLFAAVALLSAEKISIDYLDGTVELKTAKGWALLSIGDTIPTDASVRVSKGGSLELSSGTQRITLLKDGVYAVADLLKAGGKSGKAGIGVALTQKLHSMTAEKEQQGTVAGARGAQQGQGADVQWVDENEETRATVNDLFEKGKYADAVSIIKGAIADASTSDERKELSYQLAVAYYGSGKTALAFRTVSKVSPAVTVGYYPDFMILKANILLDSAAYKDGLAVLGEFLKTKPQNSYAQVAYLLSAECSRGLGDEKASAEALKTGYALDPQSETAKQISDMQGN
jgi:tetratricopeptide (TPR) repeat protein